MKNLLVALLFVVFASVLVGAEQSITTESTDDAQHSWTRPFLKQDYSDYIFYCTGHHGMIWSSITLDSSGIVDLNNGTTRNHIEDVDPGLTDSISFIKNNINTIMWGFDSLANEARLLTPGKKDYTTTYDALYVVKNHKTVFSLKNAAHFSGVDSAQFNYKLGKLYYLMFWLASPSVREYIPRPCDSISAKDGYSAKRKKRAARRR